jgi:hypothetical protein
MSTTKYSPAPQQDPDDHVSYSEAPPSYQAPAGTASFSPNDPLFGDAPRSSEDNLPDDFKVR